MLLLDNVGVHFVLATRYVGRLHVDPLLDAALALYLRFQLVHLRFYCVFQFWNRRKLSEFSIKLIGFVRGLLKSVMGGDESGKWW